MKLWVKIIIAVVGSGAIGGLTFAAGFNPTWASVFGYLNLAISGAMSIVIGWPPKPEA
jgi:hypothetical protein